jgi:hypothetical protein
MERSGRVRYTWEGAPALLERMAKTNARADATWLRSLSLEESVRIFEDLCNGIPEVSVQLELDPPPVVLSRLWRR